MKGMSHAIPTHEFLAIPSQTFSLVDAGVTPTFALNSWERFDRTKEKASAFQSLKAMSLIIHAVVSAPWRKKANVEKKRGSISD